MKEYLFTILTIFVTLTSCSDWFDVTSSSEIREKDHYNTETGFQQSLIGCYIGMTDDALYGKSLSWHALEILAHQFTPVSSSSSTQVEYQLQSYSYNGIYSNPVIEDIWAKAYNVIVNANEALQNIDEKKNIFDDTNYHVIKGELLAIRAYIHLDLLRLYGYGNWTNRASELNEKLTIPYVTTVSKEITPQATGAETLKYIQNDLEEAADLLREYDPITKKHNEDFYAEINTEGFYKNRTIRLNYYAVKALQARAYLWEGSETSKIKALNAAEEVISFIDKGGFNSNTLNTYVNLLGAGEISASNTSLANEQLFGLEIPNLSEKLASYILPNYKDENSQAMHISEDNVLALYENIPTDVRFTQLLTRSNSATTAEYTPLKIYQSTSLSTYNKNKIPLIRLPEVYYIASECYASATTPNTTKALKYLNIIRQKRGIYDDLENLEPAEILTEIGKEYHKEFLSEGVMFYYYKRTNASTVPNFNEEMSDTEYVFPYPAFELQSGRVQ
ncbi:RagB/SusD family nutrient uptake outer membrane protein [uncultured Bacteroides sp.]|uniref:RagB/SusD family nutrient uptake outer membrane protein n=1 Tax=uncultured Bacteroides sp. TaxID=162156 RepID=UPI002675CD84|nr:RagB/SusD family nutrient uptake outer membrane protein [uncultured Bacteroides sp.]